LNIAIFLLAIRVFRPAALAPGVMLRRSNPEPSMSALGQKQTSERFHVECAPNGGHLAGMELTKAAGLSEDESHGQTTFP
jgi:hypothetical protein